MTAHLEDLAHALVAAAKAAGAEAADAIINEEGSLSIEVREGALEKAERSK